MSIRISLGALAVVALAGCSSHESPSAPTSTDTNAVGVVDDRYTPGSAAVAPGAAVKWTWSGRNLHSVTFDDGVASTVQSSGTYSRTFQTPGTYNYHCAVHGLAMSGAVTVR